MKCIICGKLLEKKEREAGFDTCLSCYSFLKEKHKNDIDECFEQHRQFSNSLKKEGGKDHEKRAGNNFGTSSLDYFHTIDPSLLVPDSRELC